MFLEFRHALSASGERGVVYMDSSYPPPPPPPPHTHTLMQTPRTHTHTQESLELTNRSTRPVAATSMSFPTNDVNKFLLGSEECSVYQGQRHGSKPGISLQFEGHSGPVTSVSSHRATGGTVSSNIITQHCSVQSRIIVLGNVCVCVCGGGGGGLKLTVLVHPLVVLSPQSDYSHLFLTSSFDWTVKLWSSKLQTEQQMAVSLMSLSNLINLSLPTSLFLFFSPSHQIHSLLSDHSCSTLNGCDSHYVSIICIYLL